MAVQVGALGIASSHHTPSFAEGKTYESLTQEPDMIYHSFVIFHASPQAPPNCPSPPTIPSPYVAMGGDVTLSLTLSLTLTFTTDLLPDLGSEALPHTEGLVATDWVRVRRRS